MSPGPYKISFFNDYYSTPETRFWTVAQCIPNSVFLTCFLSVLGSLGFEQYSCLPHHHTELS